MGTAPSSHLCLLYSASRRRASRFRGLPRALLRFGRTIHDPSSRGTNTWLNSKAALVSHDLCCISILELACRTVESVRRISGTSRGAFHDYSVRCKDSTPVVLVLCDNAERCLSLYPPGIWYLISPSRRRFMREVRWSSELGYEWTARVFVTQPGLWC